MRDWNSIAPILDEVIELSGYDRERALDRACTTDPELRQAVEELLVECQNERGFLENPAAFFAASLFEHTAARPDDSLANKRIGPYLLINEIARGGMGTVWLAERADGQFQQRVALKLIKRGMDSDEISRRFIAERQILARFNHSNIARLMDGGVTDGGQPWFAMEYVEGSSITRHVTAHNMSIDQRLDLFEHVCDAVRYAHQNLVVHRDLKPSNILVTSDGTVKLLDFGISKLLDDTSSEQSQVATGLRAMTPEYAAPEQIRMEPITTATDIYALGAVLYEMLTGRKAHSFTGRAPSEIERVVCTVTPSTPAIATDIDRIVLKGLY
jgi:serine/threonine-protein kinase